MTRSEVKINGVCLNIFRSETRGVDAPFFELANKRIRNVALAVIHAVGFNRTIIELDLSLFDRDIDTAQVRAILIRPENRLRPRIADAVRLVEIVRSRAHIVVDMVEVRRAVGVVLHRSCVGNHIRLAAHDVSTRCILPNDLDVLAVVGRLDIRALIGLRRIRAIVVQRSVCVKVTRVVRRRRRTINERRQEWQCPPLIDAPLRPGRTGVVDAPPCVGSNGVHVFRRCGCTGAEQRCFLITFVDRIGAVHRGSCQPRIRNRTCRIRIVDLQATDRCRSRWKRCTWISHAIYQVRTRTNWSYITIYIINNRASIVGIAKNSASIGLSLTIRLCNDCII